MKQILILLIILNTFICTSARTLYVWTVDAGDTLEESMSEYEAVDGWYEFDVYNVYDLIVSFANCDDFEEFKKEGYTFVFNYLDLGKEITPLKADEYRFLMPMEGDFHVRLAEDMSVAIFTSDSPFYVGNEAWTLVAYNNDPCRRYDFKRMEDEDGFFVKVATVPESKPIAAGIRTTIRGWMSHYWCYEEETMKPDGVYEFIRRIPEYHGLMPTERHYVILEDSFAGTVTMKYGTSYYDPMIVEFKKETTTADMVTNDTEKVTKYFNLQGIEVKNPSNGVFIEYVDGRSRVVRL